MTGPFAGWLTSKIAWIAWVRAYIDLAFFLVHIRTAVAAGWTAARGG
jgi:hypothetical protein